MLLCALDACRPPAAIRPTARHREYADATPGYYEQKNGSHTRAARLSMFADAQQNGHAQLSIYEMPVASLSPPLLMPPPDFRC